MQNVGNKHNTNITNNGNGTLIVIMRNHEDNIVNTVLSIWKLHFCFFNVALLILLDDVNKNFK